MSTADIVLEIILLLQGTPLADFARANLTVNGDRPIVRCAMTEALRTPAGTLCKRSIATAVQRYSYRFDGRQIAVLADLYVGALDRLEPEAQVRTRASMCDPNSVDAQRDPHAAVAICARLSRDF